MGKTPYDWAHIRKQFRFDECGPTNFANMALASNPAAVREAIDRHRRKLDEQPWVYLKNSVLPEETEVCKAVTRYFEVPEANIALLTGTTLGLALMYAGINMKPGQEILTSLHEFQRALDVMDARSVREGIQCRKISLIPDPASVSTADVIARLERAICSHTRVLALTWVYSNSGVKLPIDAIANWLYAHVNSKRPKDEDKVLLCIDGVHGFGVEGVPFRELGCDFFVSGCHKWIFGPRGTGIWCGTDLAWRQYTRLVPSSPRNQPGLSNSPGGVQAHEHMWAMEEAFKFLMDIGPHDIRDRVHELASLLKAKLEKLPKVTLITPKSTQYSSGIVCLDIEGVSADDAVNKLLKAGIVATMSSTDAGRPNAHHLRLSVAMYITEAEIDKCVKAIASL